MAFIDFSVLRRGLRLEQVLQLLDFVATTQHGPQVRGPCPIHSPRAPGPSPLRKSRSFAAHLERRCWQCFVCGAHGNALDLWVAVTKLPVHAAALDLCRRLGLEIPCLADRRRPASRSPPPP